MLNIDIIEKKYGTEIILNNVCLSVDKPGIYGLVGKNGQGKTTLFRCVLGLEKYKGQCQFNAENTNLQNIAWCPSEPSIYEELTAVEFYDFYANLLDVKSPFREYLFELPKDKLIKGFSTGMRKKVYLNAVFQRQYSVYLLDEPFNGLDLESNYTLIQDLKEKAKESIVIISSHIIDVLYQNCEKIWVINNKELVEFESVNYSQIQQVLFGVK
ncbi:ATP-binding cassette domain-containing protein [Flavobacterium sp. HSC-61S13]|uniref:ATP-binding cassette domain-containing protein n=1 Tax=Flavobacterium sp. HSC-61S13 TaxID=2910963 RepID=UPI00209F4DDA|nr:ATP-binding cassette domain-containing protein [Flavobacterium sp. HSC-61S13]MCP1996311.1 ABC-2 type transport system ATP-binding protein [Flavobacterium sp. HSC-61S13]